MIRPQPVQVVALAFAVLSFFVTFVALLTPAWQVTYAREIQQWIQSGLWLSCQTRPSGMNTCTFSFSESDYDFYNAESIHLRSPPFYSWQRYLLLFYLAAQMTTFGAFISFFCNFNPNTASTGPVSFAILTTISFILHACSTLTFAVFTQMIEYRFYHVSVSGIYEKHRGYSYYIELVSTLFIFLAMICGIGSIIQRRLQRKQSRRDYRLAANNGHHFGGLDPFETELAMRDLPQTPKYALR